MLAPTAGLGAGATGTTTPIPTEVVNNVVIEVAIAKLNKGVSTPGVGKFARINAARVDGFANVTADISAPADTPAETPVYCTVAKAVGTPIPIAVDNRGDVGPITPKEDRIPCTSRGFGAHMRLPNTVPAPAVPEVTPVSNTFAGIGAQIVNAFAIARAISGREGPPGNGADAIIAAENVAGFRAILYGSDKNMSGRSHT